MKNRIRTFILICCVSLFNISGSAEACSEFFIDQDGIKVAARNMDWADDKFVLVFNPRGVSRTAQLIEPQNAPVEWTSKYGSVTVNIDAEDITQGATDGMNEHGLTAAVLWMEASKYPEADTRPGLDDGMWVQYCLDNFKTVQEVIANAPSLRVEEDKYLDKTVALHLYIHDPSGNSAILEYLDGNLVIHHGSPLSVEVLTNDPYSVNLDSLKKYEAFGGTEPLPGGYGHEARFVRASTFLKSVPVINSVKEAVAYAFDGMSDVAEPLGAANWPTQWTVVRDLTAKKIYFRNLTDPEIRIVDLTNLDFNPGQPLRMLEINADLSGDVTDKFSIPNGKKEGSGD